MKTRLHSTSTNKYLWALFIEGIVTGIAEYLLELVKYILVKIYKKCKKQKKQKQHED